MTADARVYVHAAAALGPGGTTGSPPRAPLTADPDTDLRTLTKSVLGQPLRQASHFVELCAIGARLCLDRAAAPPGPATAVYFGTGLGEVRKTESLFAAVMPPGSGVATPFDFINASPNMGAFYVARQAGFMARNLTVTQDVFSFECALALALDDLRAAAVVQALVGGADENRFPRPEHMRRLPLRDNQIMGEGSGWLLLSRDPAGARAEVIGVPAPVTRGLGAEAWARACAQTVGTGAVTILPGCNVTPQERTALAAQFPAADFQSYLEYCGWYLTASAFGVAAAFDEPHRPGRTWVHVNRNTGGSTMLIVVRSM
jgi:hypothetical protein